ncbi:glycogen debranching protein GlgX [Phenylobacterium soli]|uniref:4-alpha-glucanotransferase n=1 Tax=Phenylobacterium soli TaxID=2170551 RepID=A0A328AJ62_9CAUL|nr:glycogen debranching protein GlgX [Phenylobacterium soli]RAK54983.1 4-alpha-glucanotransferase [Phenylobacterium soli]
MTVGRMSTGSPEPLGVTLTDEGVNIAVVSGTATAIDFCLFDGAGGEQRFRLPGRTGEVFHGHLSSVGEGARYGLRAHGPWDPANGLRFDPSKLLIDPHAVALDGPIRLHRTHLAPAGEGVDSGPHVPKAIVMRDAPAAAPPISVPWDRTVIYEAHVRGLTRLHPLVPDGQRGTFAGLSHPAVIDHLKLLGVTTLELLPVAAWADEPRLQALGLTNYWGYNPVAFCAPDPRLAPGGWPEVRAATEALAAAGIEVILDVVFNHTGEGDALGPTLSLRGLDNRGYYRLDPSDPAAYLNDAGTGNTLRCEAPQTVRLVLDALRTWVRRGGLAGFRFDLATVLGRRRDGFDPEAPLLTAILQDPELRGLKLIAEPWDIGPGGYQLGRFPAAFAEWNDRYRETVRRFWRGRGATLGELATRLAGSEDVFAARGRPSRSLNYVTAHDGFTLADLVSYASKHNLANGEDNRDGSDHEGSWNGGHEGPSGDPDLRARRLADQRALLATLLVSRGTPMLQMGAELGHSQGGNNNAYCQDNETSWVDWRSADLELAGYVGRLIDLRQRHPSLSADAFLHGEARDGPLPDVAWSDAEGAPLDAAGWEAPEAETLVVALARYAPGPDPDRVTVVIHRGEGERVVRVPHARDGHAWRIASDSADPARAETIGDRQVVVAARSVVLLEETAARRRRASADDAVVAQVASAAGIASVWQGLDGVARQVTPQSQRALLAAMGFAADTPDLAWDSLWRLEAPRRAILPACVVRRADEPVVVPVRAADPWLLVTDEAGGSWHVQARDGVAHLGLLAAGRYGLRSGGAAGRLIVVPTSAFEPASLAYGERLFGLSAQLYAVPEPGRSIGDLATLRALGRAAAGEGANLLAINPLHALFADDRTRVSPYHPSDRRFIDPLYIDVGPVAGAQAEALIDYAAVWTSKAAALQALPPLTPPEAQAFDAFQGERGPALRQFALFQTIAEQHPGQPWATWPEGLRSPSGAEVDSFARAHADRIAFHEQLQWRCDAQLAAAAIEAPGLGLCRDLAVGAAADGAEVWSGQERFALAASVGAPPDAFAPHGQVWALPPPIPHRWTAEGYEGFADLLRANMRHAGALRIDHVLGLRRLFWVPEGAEGADGAYVSYPFEDLLGVLALESARAECLVVGEDLGTVPDGLQHALSAAKVYGYSVMRFEREGQAFRVPVDYRPKALACATTHDLPPLAAWWSGEDLAERLALGLLPAAGLDEARAERRSDKAALLAALVEAGEAGDWSADSAWEPPLAAAIHGFLAASESQLVLVQLEDLAGDHLSQNVPGTDRERPNWRHRTSLGPSGLGGHAIARAVLARIRSLRPPVDLHQRRSPDSDTHLKRTSSPPRK